VKRLASVLALIVALMYLAVPALAHSGRTDANGGHYNRATGEYHYHHGYPEHQHPGGVCPYDYHDDTDPYGGDSPDVDSNDRPSYLDLSDEEWDALVKSIEEEQEEVQSRYTWRRHKNKNATATPTVTPSPSPSPTPTPSPSPTPSPTPTPSPSPSLYPSPAQTQSPARAPLHAEGSAPLPYTENFQGDPWFWIDISILGGILIAVIAIAVYSGGYRNTRKS